MIKKRIKSPKSSKQKIKKHISTEIEIDYPVFCFKHLRLNNKKDYKFYLDFIIRLNNLSNLSWDIINTSHRHGFGTEKIPINKIKPSLPKFISPDVNELLVFRANGDNRPFLGIRKKNLFHIIFIEEKFGDVYEH